LSEPEKKPESNKLFYRMQAEDVDLATDIRTSILAQTPKGGRAILWVVFALLVLFLIWAYFSEIEQVTRGDGKVVPSTQIQIVQNLEGGTGVNTYRLRQRQPGCLLKPMEKILLCRLR
jgi:adhesin transport system membrane fusion protein